MARKPAEDPLVRVLDRAEKVLARLEALLPAPPPEVDWTAVYQWTRNITFAHDCISQPVVPRGNIWTCDHMSSGGEVHKGKIFVV